jgi:hypothetical protein
MRAVFWAIVRREKTCHMVPRVSASRENKKNRKGKQVGAWGKMWLTGLHEWNSAQARR